MTGELRSTLYGPNGPTVVQFPRTLQTVALPVLAAAFAEPELTAVASENVALDGVKLAKVEFVARPDSPSVAVQFTVTFEVCQAELDGGLHDTAGAVASTSTVTFVVDESPAASVTVMDTAVAPSLVNGTSRGTDVAVPAVVCAPVSL